MSAGPEPFVLEDVRRWFTADGRTGLLYSKVDTAIFHLIALFRRKRFRFNDEYYFWLDLSRCALRGSALAFEVPSTIALEGLLVDASHPLCVVTVVSKQPLPHPHTLAGFVPQPPRQTIELARLLR